MDLLDYPICEVDLSSHFREQIVYFYLNLTRKNDAKLIQELAISVRQFLELLKSEIRNDDRGVIYLELMYKLIIHTRDITSGKGEHDLFYMLVYELYREFPILAIYLLHHFIETKIGCWRDIKYLCDYVRKISPKSYDDTLIDICVELVNTQLKRDVESWNFSVNAGSRNHISNVAKWIPREKKKCGWLFERLVVHWSNTYNRWKVSWSSNGTNYLKALNKSKKIYRKIITRLNKNIDTTEIKQCFHLWDDININNLSKYTVMKQQRLFYASNREITPKDNPYYFNDFCKDVTKQKCSKNYIDNHPAFQLVNGSARKNINIDEIVQLPISYFIKEAFRLFDTGYDSQSQSFQIEKCILNKKWQQFSNHNFHIHNLLPIIDVSYKMLENDAESFYTAVGIAILVCQKSNYGKRILAIDNLPTWINLDESTDFYSTVRLFNESIRSRNNTACSFKKGIDFLVDAISDSGSDFYNMKLLFLSNSLELNGYYEYIEKRFIEINHSIPEFIFWNLSKTRLCELPTNSKILLLSGFSATPLKHINYFRDYNTNYDIVCRLLDNPKYAIFTDYLHKLVNN
jgi:hypothetical protein